MTGRGKPRSLVLKGELEHQFRTGVSVEIIKKTLVIFCREIERCRAMSFEAFKNWDGKWFILATHDIEKEDEDRPCSAFGDAGPSVVMLIQGELGAELCSEVTVLSRELSMPKNDREGS